MKSTFLRDSITVWAFLGYIGAMWDVKNPSSESKSFTVVNLNEFKSFKKKLRNLKRLQRREHSQNQGTMLKDQLHRPNQLIRYHWLLWHLVQTPGSWSCLKTLLQARWYGIWLLLDFQMLVSVCLNFKINSSFLDNFEYIFHSFELTLNLKEIIWIY